MAAAHPNLADLTEDNRLLRQAIDEAGRHLDSAAASLRKALVHEVLVEETPMEMEAAMESAADAIAAASRTLQQSTAQRSAREIPGGPTRRQGQFLAYIREYMLRNHLGAAPTHAEFQRFFNLTPPSVNSMLKRLDQRGFIRRIPGKTRAIELTIDPELIPTLDRPFKQ
jgi:DNA-binding MarR family transcriptional regulator